MKNLFHKLPGFAADYSGAMLAVSHMRCLRILHGQGGCSGGVCTCDDYESETDDWRTLFSKISEIETITGNDEKLVEMIADASDSMDPDWVLLLGSPIPMIIATDYRAIASKVEMKTGKPVHPVSSWPACMTVSIGMTRSKHRKNCLLKSLIPDTP